MCRSIKTLRREGEVATDDEIAAAALQFVRKLSGYRQPSRANTEAFDRAVEDVAKVSRRMLDSLAPVGTRGDAPSRRSANSAALAPASTRSRKRAT